MKVDSSSNHAALPVRARPYDKGVYCVSIGAFAYALFQTVQLAKIDTMLLLTTPLIMLPLCLFGLLVALTHVKRYPVYGGMAAYLSLLTALMV